MSEEVKEDDYWYQIDMGDGTAYLQRKGPTMATERPLNGQEAVIVRLCQLLTLNPNTGR